MPATHEMIDADAQFIHMDGNEVFKFAVRTMAEALKEAVRRAGLATSDLDWVISHQANIRIIDSAVKRLEIPPERFIINLERFGNTSAASIPLALCAGIADGRIKKGDLVMFEAMGGGFTWGASLVRM